MPALALGPEPGEDILDICAAPGGKASHIAAITDNHARLWLNDGIRSRLRKLREVVDLLGVRYERMTAIPAQYLDKEISKTFDRILLDAQCSGEGMIDISRSDSCRFWSIERIEKYSHLQKKMLTVACKLLKPGGTLVYSTCTFAPEENEMVINHILKHRDDMCVKPIFIAISNMYPGRTTWRGERLHESLGHARRIMPSEYMEGFFVCKLRKTEG